MNIPKFLYEIYKGKEIHFGARGMDDFLVHRDPIRRASYRKRARGIKLKNGKPAYLDRSKPAFYAYNILW